MTLFIALLFREAGTQVLVSNPKSESPVPLPAIDGDPPSRVRTTDISSAVPNELAGERLFDPSSVVLRLLKTRDRPLVLEETLEVSGDRPPFFGGSKSLILFFTRLYVS